LADLFDEFPMLLFILEAGVALLVLILIVVWTMMGRKENDKRK
jgi:high-affinity Fe2+/Pb2+ permease